MDAAAAIGAGLLAGAPVMLYLTLRGIIAWRVKTAGLAFLIFLAAIIAVPTDAAIYVVLAAYAAPLVAWGIKRLRIPVCTPTASDISNHDWQPAAAKPSVQNDVHTPLGPIASRSAENDASALGETVATTYGMPERTSINPLAEVRERLASGPASVRPVLRAERPWKDDLDEEPIASRLWRGNKRVTFDYMDSTGDITTRDVNAVRVDHKHGETYLVGYDMTRRATRTFRADRILGDVIDMETGEVGSFDDIFA